jgi:metal-responsive CopG/Arc/MetJ family transcriptional regulator
METKKTTVSFPANLLLAMRKYMAEEGMNLHSQSDLVVDALREYLEKRGVEIPNKAGKVVYQVEQVGSA